ncbi:MAG TPA: hypothetical protein VF885_24305 [Arthrobacter sp.]
MGHWETEHGDIVLPSAEFAAVRQAVQKAEHEHQMKVFEETQTFWKGLTRKEQTDPEAYRAALRKHTAERRRLLESALQGWGRRSVTPHAEEIIDDVDWRLSLARDAKPARVLKADLPFPTNRTTEFRAGEGFVTFKKDSNTVVWETGQYRNVIDKARSSPAGAALFEAIRKVKWTRGTGGVFYGNNENHSEEAWDRGDYATTAYGPIGAASEPSRCQEYTDSKGTRVTDRDLTRIQQELWDAQRKLQNRMAKATGPAGRGKTTAASNRGSFAAYGHSEPTFRL